jgi:hypothetical protein
MEPIAGPPARMKLKANQLTADITSSARVLRRAIRNKRAP